MSEPPPAIRPAAGRWQRATILAVLLVAVTAFFALGGGHWLSLDALQARRADLLAFTGQNFWTMIALSGVVYATATALSLPGAAILSLLTGFLFGRVTGTVVIVIAATAGATALLLLTRYLFATAARERLEGNARAAKLLAGFEQGAFSYLLFLRLVPVFPFWLVNLAAALTRIPVRTFVGATVIGIIPGSFVFANLGRFFGSINSTRGLLSVDVLVSLGLLGLLALVPLVVRLRPLQRLKK